MIKTGPPKISQRDTIPLREAAVGDRRQAIGCGHDDAGGGGIRHIDGEQNGGGSRGDRAEHGGDKSKGRELVGGFHGRMQLCVISGLEVSGERGLYSLRLSQWNEDRYELVVDIMQAKK